MTIISFYHLSRSPLGKVLPILLKKTLSSGERAVVIAGTNERVESLNSLLWTDEPNEWIPHGAETDGLAEQQPIWLTTVLENPNAAKFLFLIDDVSADSFDGFTRCFDLFDGRKDQSVEAAKKRWKIYSERGHECHYHQQSEDGGWEEKIPANSPVD